MNESNMSKLFRKHFIDFKNILRKLYNKTNSLEYEFKMMKMELLQVNQKFDDLNRFQEEILSKIINSITRSGNLSDVHSLNSKMINSKSLTPSITDTIEKSIDYIKLHFADDVSREGLAESFGVSPDHFSRMFKKYTGKKIKDFINELRIENVIKLISEDNKKIIDIALECGFENVRSFNIAFKRIKGMTPTEYKKFNHWIS